MLHLAKHHCWRYGAVGLRNWQRVTWIHEWLQNDSILESTRILTQHFRTWSVSKYLPPFTIFYLTLINDNLLTAYIWNSISIRISSSCFLLVSREEGYLTVVAGCGMTCGEGEGASDRLQLSLSLSPCSYLRWLACSDIKVCGQHRWHTTWPSPMLQMVSEDCLQEPAWYTVLCMSVWTRGFLLGSNTFQS